MRLLRHQKIRKKIFPILKKTIKSLNRREEITCTVLVLVMALSGYFFYKSSGLSGQLPSLENQDEKQIYTEGLVGQIKRLNPVYRELNPVDRDISQLIFSGLSKYDPLQKTFVEDLAIHSLSKDKKTYTFVIKPGVVWHDGQPVTADDIYFTYSSVIQSPEFNNPIVKSNFQGVSLKKIDAKTVTFDLKEANSFFFSNVTIGLLPYHILKDVPVSELEKNSFNLNPIGTGPYQIKEALKVSHEQNWVTLEIFPHYYGDKPHLKIIKFISFPSLEDLIKGKTSIHGVARLSETASLKNLWDDPRFKLYKYTLPQYTAVFVNTSAKYLQNANVRLALSKAINKEELIKNLENKRRIDTPIMELNQDDWLHKPDFTEAKGALYDAGWFLENETSPVRKNRKDEKLKLNLLISKYPLNPHLEAETVATAEFLQKSWQAVGVDVTIESLEGKELQEKIRARAYDLLLYGQSLGYNLDTYSYWHSSQANQNGLNLSNYRSATADSLIESIRTWFEETDEDKAIKQKKIENLATTIDKETPAIFLYTPLYYFAADSQLTNIELSNLAFPSDRFAYSFNWIFSKE